MTITLPIPVKSLCPNGRAHWRTKATATKAHRALAKVRTLEALGGQPAPRFTGYSLTFYFKNVRGRDDDNATASCKAYRDGIADALGVDDNTLRLLGEPIMELDRQHPRVEVTLKSEYPPAVFLREPLRVSYSREELAEKMKDWMIETWGNPKDLKQDAQDRWMERNGMLYAFICDHFPVANV